jgi:hypothetical protein
MVTCCYHWCIQGWSSLCSHVDTFMLLGSLNVFYVVLMTFITTQARIVEVGIECFKRPTTMLCARCVERLCFNGFQYFRRELFTEMVHTCFFVVKVHNWIYHEANKNVFFFNSVHYLLWFSLQCYIYMIFICCKSMLQTTNFVFGIFSFCRNATYVFFVT